MTGVPDRLVGTTRWRTDTHGVWSTRDETTAWTLQYRPEATPPLRAGWTLHCAPPHLVFQEPLYGEGNLACVLRWATGYVHAVRINAEARRKATVLSDQPKDRNVRVT